MKKVIRTYEDLQQEELRLQSQLASYKILIKDDFAGLKAGLNPFKKVKDTVKSLFTRGNNGPLMNFGLNFGFDVLVRKYLLGRAGWLTKVVVPYLIKNYASHLVTEEQKHNITRNISKFFSKVFHKKKKDTPSASPAF